MTRKCRCFCLHWCSQTRLTPLPETTIIQHQLELPVGVREVRERSDERRVDVCRRLRVLVVVPLVGELVLLVGPADHRVDVDVGVGPTGVERGEPLRAPDPARVRGHGRQRGRAVVDAARVLGPVPDHVRHPHRVAAQEVVHLPPRDLAQPLRRDQVTVDLATARYLA
jgi:hypothetical protein